MRFIIWFDVLGAFETKVYAQDDSSQLANATAWGSDVRQVDIFRDTLVETKLM